MPRLYRHYRQRFNPAEPMVFIRGVTIGTTRFGPGDAVPPEIDVRSLRKFWDAERIALAEWPPSEKKPLTDDEKLAEVIAALDPDDPDLFTADGVTPLTSVLTERAGFRVSAKMRNRVMANG